MTVLRHTLRIAPDDPAFDGHFPGRPILPGVVLLAEVLAAIEQAAGRPLGALTVRQAKFHAVVAPGATLSIALDFTEATPGPPGVASPGAPVAFEVTRGPDRIASGVVVPATDAGPGPLPG